MEIKRDITLMLEPLIETSREAERDKYLPNDRLLIAQIQLIYFPIYPRGGGGNREGLSLWGGWQKERRQAAEKRWREGIPNYKLR